jgi:hypothetical protein
MIPKKAEAGEKGALVVDHPNEHARTVLSPETKRSLAQHLV